MSSPHNSRQNEIDLRDQLSDWIDDAPDEGVAVIHAAIIAVRASRPEIFGTA